MKILKSHSHSPMSGLAALLALSVAAGCSGKLDSAAAGSGPNGTTGPGATPMGTAGTSAGPGVITGAGGTSTIPVTMNPPDPTMMGTTPVDVNRVPIHRLNQAEYDNTVKDLLGVTSTPANSFIADETAYGFDNIAEAFNMTDVRFEQYYNAADALVDTVFADPTLKARIMTCTPAGATDTACIGQIISSFGLRAWRRPITAAEVTRLTQVATDAIALGTDATGGVQQVVKTMLASLPFLYRVEMDPAPNMPTSHALDPYELASRLSYLTWSSMPDDTLFGLAQNGTLVNNDVLSAQVDRMMADPKANSFVLNFAGQWLGMRKLLTHAVDPGAYPAWTQAQATQMAAALSSEGLAYFNQFLAGPAGMNEFLTTVPNAADPNRVGFMGLKGFLTLTSFPYRTAPTLRGKWVLENLLCQSIPAPPANVPKLDDPAAPTTMVQSENVRIRLEAHRQNPMCNGCHSTLDPIGMGLENYDGVGEYRTTYANGDAVNPAGQLPAQWNNAMFSSLPELATILSSDSKMTDCASKELLTYALGRGIVPSDDGYLAQIRKAWSDAGPLGMKSLMKQIVLNDTFRFRRGEGMVTQ